MRSDQELRTWSLRKPTPFLVRDKHPGPEPWRIVPFLPGPELRPAVVLSIADQDLPETRVVASCNNTPWSAMATAPTGSALVRDVARAGSRAAAAARAPSNGEGVSVLLVASEPVLGAVSLVLR